MFKKIKPCLTLLIFFLFSSSFPLSALDKPYDYSLWDQFLKKFVNEEGQVNYAEVKKDPKLLNDYLKQIKNTSYGDLAFHWPREERLAFWINAYHAGLISQVVQHYPIKNVLEIPSVWDVGIIQVDKFHYSLNEIRKDMLVKVFHDEKIDTALSCGAKSCPKLFPEAFTGPRVDGQLFLRAREFVNGNAHNKIVPGEKKIWISKIFKWYGVDFKLDFGASENDRGLSAIEYAVVSFIAHYLNDPQKIQYLEEGNYKIKYLFFDSTLHDWRPSSSGAAKPPSK